MAKAFKRSWIVGILTLIGVVLVALGIGIELLPERLPTEALFAPPPPGSDITLTANDRLLILAPHPDDEVLGCGGIIQQAVALKIPVHIAFLTYGDSNEWSFIVYSRRPVMGGRGAEKMGEVRHDEALAADAQLGVPASDISFMGYPDHGTLDMFTSHWGDKAPLRALLTRARAVPYSNAMRPGAPYKPEEVVTDMESILRSTRPTRIFVTPPYDANVDHRSLYLYLQVALWDLAKELQPTPQVFTYLVHWPKWPRPLGYHPDNPVHPPVELKQLPWHVFPLPSQLVNIERDALKQHKTQMSYSANYLTAFMKSNELFGDPLRMELSARTVANGETTAQALPCAEPPSLVGNEWRFVRLDADHRLELSLEESKPLANETQASFYAFGYRPDRPFATMPKLHLQVNPLNSSADDQGRRITSPDLEMTHHGRSITVKIPLHLLGDPDRVLVSTRTWLGTVSLDWNVWYELDLPPTSTP